MQYFHSTDNDVRDESQSTVSEASSNNISIPEDKGAIAKKQRHRGEEQVKKNNVIDLTINDSSRDSSMENTDHRRRNEQFTDRKLKNEPSPRKSVSKNHVVKKKFVDEVIVCSSSSGVSGEIFKFLLNKSDQF